MSKEPSVLACAVELEDYVLAPGFPCLGARSAVRNRTCHVDSYAALDIDDQELERLAEQLRNFVSTNSDPRSAYAVHVAVESFVTVDSEQSFERYLWSVLGRLHNVDRDDWDPKYSRDPGEPTFKFSFAERSFYVVGLSPVSSRRARSFAYPALVFNPVWQFERLRELGKLDVMIDQIRTRDIKLQGDINPNLQYEGVFSDALQYSGMKVDSGWTCPFPFDVEDKSVK